MRHTLIAAACVLCTGFPAQAEASNFPFGSRPVAYAPGTLLPDHLSAAILDQQVQDFYDAWKERYLAEECGTGRYVVLTRVGGGNLTVSEGHGYGMMLVALMAGHDPHAREIFDGMYAYAVEHPTTEHPHLMSWNQTKKCVDADDGDSSATDGDMDIAYALLLADAQWGSCGAVDYRGAALAVLGDIVDGTIDADGSYPLLGNWVSASDPEYYAATRSSDFLPAHFRSFAAASGSPVWSSLLDDGYQRFASIQATWSPATGLVPDFIVDPAGTPAPAGPFFLESDTDGAYSYNACRVPWRIGVDNLLYGDARAADIVDRITRWLRVTTSDDPSRIGAGYWLDGSPVAGTDYRSMAFVAPLGIAAMVDPDHAEWLDSLWDFIVATSIDDEAYYENTLKLLTMIVMSGNWWAPDMVNGGCVAQGNRLCRDGGYLQNVRIKTAGLARGVGRQSLSIQGDAFFPAGVPVPTLDSGAQILVEDAGTGGTVIYELTVDTAPVPASSASGCDPIRDAWKVGPKATMYRNRSGSLDAPACTPRSANGLRQIRYRPGSARDVEFRIRAVNADVSPVVGPLRLSLVFGDDTAAGSAGACAISRDIECASRSTSFTCR